MKNGKLLFILPLLATPLFSGCNQQEATEINVFAAASLTETLTKIQDLYAQKDSKVKLVFNFESSGTLKTQIENGAKCDLFISAAPKQMNQLEELNLINKESRLNLLENKVALAVPENNPKNVTSFENMCDRLKADEEGFLIAMGNSDVPVGQYTQKIFQYYNVDETAVASHITYGQNVKAVTSAVSNKAVACGVIYQTDAFSANLTVVAHATKEMCGQVIYPAAITAKTENYETSKAFLDYLHTEEALKVFEEVGFSRM